MEDYLDLFDLAAHQIQGVLQSEAAKERGKMNNIIIGRAATASEICLWSSRLGLWLRDERGIFPGVKGSQHRAPHVGFLCSTWIARKFLPFPGGCLLFLLKSCDYL